MGFLVTLSVVDGNGKFHASSRLLSLSQNNSAISRVWEGDRLSSEDSLGAARCWQALHRLYDGNPCLLVRRLMNSGAAAEAACLARMTPVPSSLACEARPLLDGMHVVSLLLEDGGTNWLSGSASLAAERKHESYRSAQSSMMSQSPAQGRVCLSGRKHQDGQHST